MSDTLVGWVDGELRARYGKVRAIAEMIGMTESGFARGLKRGTLSVDHLLELARATDTHPSTVLRLAGKGHVADLLEQLYGSGHGALTKSQRELIENWATLPDDVRAHFVALLRHARSVAEHNPAGRTPAHPQTRKRPRQAAATRTPRASAARPE